MRSQPLTRQRRFCRVPLTVYLFQINLDFFPPLALFCVGDTLLCRELRLASSQGFIYAVVSLSHSFSSCGHIVATVAQWSALSPHSEKVAGSIPTRGLSDWGSECSSCAQIPKTCTLRQLVHGVTPPLTQDSWDMTLSAG